MIRIDLQQLTADVFRRVHSDPQGAAVRALLAAGNPAGPTASVISLERLSKPFPSAPFLALQQLGAPSLPGGPHQATFVWWCYDTPEHGFWRVRGLLRPLARAYDGFRSTGGPVSSADLVAGDARPDQALGLLLIPVTLTLVC